MAPENDSAERIMASMRVWNTIRCVYFTLLIVFLVPMMLENYVSWAQKPLWFQSTNDLYERVALTNLICCVVYCLFTIAADAFLYQMGRSVLNLIKKPQTAEKGICFMRVIFFTDVILQLL